MTVKEWIAKWLLNQTERRYEKLKEIGAPKVIFDGIEKQLEMLKQGEVKVGGDKDALNDEWNDSETKLGRGGKTYYVINGNIRFFPQAQYGMFIKRIEEAENYGA